MALAIQFSPKIIGPGTPGYKTRDLMKFAGQIEQIDVKMRDKKLTFSLPASASVTPELCRKFEKEAGCSEKDSPESAKEKMMNCKSGEFEGAIGEVYRFHHQANRSWPFAVRSDDFGATGVLSTSFVHVNTNNRDSHQIGNIKEAAIQVLASSFSDQAREMARIFAKWGSEGTGILVNPYYGHEIEMKMEDVISGPAYSLAYLAPLEKSDYSVWQVSRGIAASPHGNPDMGKVFTTGELMTLEVAILSSQYYNPVGLGARGGWLPKPVLFKPTFSKEVIPDVATMASMLLDSAMSQIRKNRRLYAELVCEESKNLYNWVVLQISGMEWASFTKPRTSVGRQWMQTKRVMGFADRETHCVYFSGNRPDDGMQKYNSEHKGYLLVIDVKMLTEFAKYWKIGDYGNAGAIVFVASDVFNPVQSHVGGLLRMLDIPTIAFDKDRDNGPIEKLRALGKDAAVRVVVDESEPIGGLTKI